MAERALGDQSPKVRAAAARALGRMGAVSSVPKLKAVLNDKEPAVVLAAAHALFLLGDREEAYEIDYEMLIGEQKCADGFVKSQMNPTLLNVVAPVSDDKSDVVRYDASATVLRLSSGKTSE